MDNLYLENIIKEIGPIHLDGTDAVYELEHKIANYYGKKYCLLLNNATSAILLLAISLDLNQSNIIVPAFGWCGSLSPFIRLGNTFSLCSVDEDFCLNPLEIESLVTAKTKAILSIDLGGFASNSKMINEVAKKNGLIYISDSAQSLGSMRDGKPAGANADIVITSFTSGKSIYAGEGAAIITDNSKVFESIVKLSQHPHRQKKIFGMDEWNPFTPFNARIHPLAAVIANSNFNKLEFILSKRRAIAKKALNKLVLDGVLSVNSVNSRCSTFFEYFFNPLSRQLHNLDKCSFDQWYIENDTKYHNIYSQLLKYYPKLIDSVSNTVTTNLTKSPSKLVFKW